jgi:hypothetical protein
LRKGILKTPQVIHKPVQPDYLDNLFTVKNNRPGAMRTTAVSLNSDSD